MSLHDGYGLAVYIADALVCVALFILRDREIFARNFRQILLVFLFFQIVVLKLATSHIDNGEHVPFILVASCCWLSGCGSPSTSCCSPCSG